MSNDHPATHNAGGCFAGFAGALLIGLKKNANPIGHRTMLIAHRTSHKAKSKKSKGPSPIGLAPSAMDYGLRTLEKEKGPMLEKQTTMWLFQRSTAKFEDTATWAKRGALRPIQFGGMARRRTVKRSVDSCGDTAAT